jgi:hypothetical protein
MEEKKKSGVGKREKKGKREETCNRRGNRGVREENELKRRKTGMNNGKGWERKVLRKN